MNWMRRTLPIMLAATAVTAHGQFYKLHGGSVSVGGFGKFDTALTSSADPVNTNVPSPIGPLSQTTTQGQQYTTDAGGGLASMLFHPVKWAGVEVNYSYTHYSERFTFIDSSQFPVASHVSIPTTMQEATGAYVFHPRHIPYQPFVNIGGGGLYFNGGSNSAQWRGAGLLEAGFDLVTRNPHLAFRVEGRTLYYRAPNFNTPTLSSRSWRVSAEPAISAVYRF